MPLTNNIIELNRDVEPLIIQGKATRTRFFSPLYDDKFETLQFVHFADVHRNLASWNRIVEYINHYEKYISFALHTGDYCEGNQIAYTDLYEAGEKCVKPIYNCVGNHDCVTGKEGWKLAEKHLTHGLLFNHADEWDVNFCDLPFSMSYYKDIPEANVRIITLDLYYNISEQRVWLKDLLDDAKQKGLCVITAMHETTGYVENTYNVSFYSYNDFNKLRRFEENARTEYAFDTMERKHFEDIIVDFIKSGGAYICNLAGHDHHDVFGLSECGILNSVVPSATSWDGWCDGKRVKGTKTQDCFNVISIDANIGLLKIVRVGNNIDHYLRSRTALCYDYINKKVISNL